MTVKIYVANLGAYNAGHLIGEWIDLPLDAETLQERLDAILAAKDEDGDLYGEELAIHDFEAPWNIEETRYIKDVNEYAARLVALDETDEEVIEAILGNFHDADEGLMKLENGEYCIYSGCKDMSDVAYELIESSGMLNGVPDELTRYFDYDAYGRDLEIEGTYLRYNGTYDARGTYTGGYVEIHG